MNRISHALAVAAVTLPLLAPITATQAQPLSRRLSINGHRIAAPSNRLLRADAPIPGSGRPDPSLANAFNFRTADGTNLNGVGNFIVPDPDDPRFVFTCSASRIGLRTIITAAHCVTDDNTGKLLSTWDESFVRFLGPGSNDAMQKWVYDTDVTSIHINPVYHGFNNPSTYLFGDLAVVNFQTPLASFATTYDLFTNVPIGQRSTLAGYGTFGTGNGPTDFDFGRRWGTNQVDYIPTDPTFSDFLDLYTDFDDPERKWDTLCLFLGACDPARSTEAGTAPGDSGGPLFINGMLAGVTSFGTYVCDPFQEGCEPFVSDPSRPFDAFGSLHGFAPIYASPDFIQSSMAPEPGTIALFATGLILIGGIARRRTRAADVM
jgi:hypothetical protein